MRKYNRVINLLLLVILSTSMVMGCGKKVKSDVIGKWCVTELNMGGTKNNNLVAAVQNLSVAMLFDEGNIIEFINEEKISFNMFGAEYTWLNDNKIEILSSENEDGSLIFDVTIDGDIMTLENGAVVKLERYSKNRGEINNKDNGKVINKDNNKTGEEEAAVNNTGTGNTELISVEDKTEDNDDWVIKFEDSDLEEVVRREIGKGHGEILQSDIEDMTTLIISNNNIKSIAGVERLTNLRVVEFYNNVVVDDITPLTKLENLKELRIESDNLNEKIRNFNFIKEMKGLTKLRVFHRNVDHIEEIDDISYIESLSELTELSITCKKLKDINSLSGLIKLRKLNLNVDSLGDIEALSNFSELEDLRIFTYSSLDMSPIKNHVKMKKLDLGGYMNQYDISSLGNLANLESLHMRAPNEISVIGNYKNLKELDLNMKKCNTSEISNLTNLTKLTKLKLTIGNLSDISFLKSFTKLRQLTLVGEKIEDITPLSNLNNLAELKICYTSVSDVTPLKNLKKLKVLSLQDNNKITDFTPLSEIFNNLVEKDFSI